MSDTPHYDTLIVGAGMSGLAAAIRLAHFGQRVAVLERHSLWGGLNSFYKLRGRRHDVGLHALTNFAPKEARKLPLSRALRQLRISRDELRLGEQTGSEIRFPDLRLRFSNDFALLESDIAAAFPAQRDGFARLVRDLRALEGYAPEEVGPGAREVLRGYLDDPLLVDALLLPLCYYGSAREGDVDWYQFVVLFKSLYFEGFARPEGGIRTMLSVLIARLKESGAELRLNCGVDRILVRDGVARGVRLDGGEELTCDRLLSSAGYVETLRLCGPEHAARVTADDEGRLSFVETISIQDRPPAERGHEAAVLFFNDADRFEYRPPDSLVEVTSGVVCSPNNYATGQPLEEGVVRVTVLANPEGWMALDEDEYREQKDLASELSLAAAARWVPDPRPVEIDRDTFTPRTIRRFTGHVNGAVYGSPTKRLDGATGIEHLYLCGTDQGLLGVVGALLSGITIANRHALAAPSSS